MPLLAPLLLASSLFSDQVKTVVVGADAVCSTEIAAAFAPTLWFSPDEPLIQSGIEIPSAVPGDALAGRVVYYQGVVRGVEGSPSKSAGPSIAGCADEVWRLKSEDELTVRYYFYYPQDIGTNSHPHDLESAEFEISVLAIEDGQALLQLDSVRGFAHGLGWLANRLDVAKLRGREPRQDPRLRLPLTILVEEGKHASCPDRNGDGLYSPGYDVNVLLREAWGIRDTFGSGVLVPRFSSELFKPRSPDGVRVWPAGYVRSGTLDVSSEPHYSLRAARAAYAVLSASPEWKSSEKLREIVHGNHFGASKADSKTSRAMGWAGENLSFVVRRDVGARAALLGKIAHLPVVDGWLIGRLSKGFTRNHDWGFELVYSPTASGWVSPYASGLGYGIPREGKKLAWNNFQYRPELGIKLRFGRDELPPPLPRILKTIFPLGKLGRFIGVRVGFRAEPIDDVLTPDTDEGKAFRGRRTIRFVWEIGGGAW